MGVDFPVPRVQLPRVEVSPHERQARKAQMERMLANALDAYTRYREVDQKMINPKRWKHIETRERLRLYRERKLGANLYKSSTTSDEDVTSHGLNSYWEDIVYDAISADDHQQVMSMMMVGDLQGRVEDAIYAGITKNNQELALVHTFLYDDIGDSMILNMMEGPTKENPLHFLGYKWLVKKAPGNGKLVRHRDVVYLESSGITTDHAGEKIGYLLIDSVDLPDFPEMPQRNCVRAIQSVSVLFRQKNDSVMDVFVTGNVELSGKVVRPLTSMLTAQSIFTISKVMDLAECRRLTNMLVSQRQVREERLSKSNQKQSQCSLCHQKRKFYNGVSLTDCSICGRTICTRCQTHKRVYIADGNLGRYHRVGVCKPCVMDAAPSRVKTNQGPIKTSIAARLQRHNSTSVIDNAMENLTIARSRSTSDVPVGDGNERQPIQTMQTTMEEEFPVVSTRSRRGSVDFPSKRSGGITLLESDSLAPPTPSSRGRTIPTTTALVPTNPSPHRTPSTPHRTPSTPSRTANRYLTQTNESSLVIRPSPSTPTFTSSAPGGTYHITNQLVETPRLRRAPSVASASPSHQDLFQQMLELRRVAESTYHTTRQNQLMMEQQRSGRGY